MKLIHQILSSDNLRAAWEEVAENKGAPGVDRVSIARWRLNWEERLANLSEAVRANTYQPRPLRRFTIPKKDGSPRQMAILTVDDRVLQRAVLRIVDNSFERTFLECSYGYRQRRGVRNAIPAILQHRQRGRTWVLDADIDECFPSLDHALLLDSFAAVVDDAVVLNLVRLWLKAGKGNSERAVGIPLGAVISPLLCNCLLHRLDAALVNSGFHPVRYADDFCVFCRSEKEAQQAWQATESALVGLKLRLEPTKRVFLKGRVSLANGQIHSNLPDRSEVYRMDTY